MSEAVPRDPRLALIADSYARLLGQPLVDAQGDLAEALWQAPRVIVAHGTEADPVFFYGNRLALHTFDMDFAPALALFGRAAGARGAGPLAGAGESRWVHR